MWSSLLNYVVILSREKTHHTFSCDVAIIKGSPQVGFALLMISCAYTCWSFLQCPQESTIKYSLRKAVAYYTMSYRLDKDKHLTYSVVMCSRGHHEVLSSGRLCLIYANFSIYLLGGNMSNNVPRKAS
jgi:hypothetical protein